MTLPRESGRFVKGQRYSPMTQIKMGERRSPATEFRSGERRSKRTEFRPGQTAHNRTPVGTVRVRRETHTGLLRAWIKVSEPNVWKKRAVVAWEAIHGPVPRGSVIHHKDRDSLNDDPPNLEALTRKQHTEVHREELSAWR